MPHRSTIAAIALLALFSVHAASVIPKKSITIDEPAMIAVGLAALHTGNVSMGPDTPPLVKVWSALPLIFMDLKIPWSAEGWQEQTHWKFGNDFFAANVPPSYYRMIFFSRLQMVWIACVFGWFIFKWSRRLFGETPALFALALFTTEPNILAHAILVKTDIAAALTFLLFYYFLTIYIERPSRRAAVNIGLALGLALITKLSSTALIPVCVAAVVMRGMVADRRTTKSLKDLLMIGIISWIILQAGYGFESLRGANPPTTAAVTHWGILTHFLPRSFLAGNDVVFSVLKQGWPAFLHGQFSQHGWWYYYPIAFGIKLPLITLGIFLFAMLIGLWKSVSFLRSNERVDWLVLTAAAGIYGAASVLSNVNAGIRHTFPMFGPLFVLSSYGAWCAFRSKSNFSRAIPFVLIALQLVSILRVYPDYISYFNESIGGPSNGWHYLGDSNIDWGQDLPGLARFVHDHRIDRVRLAYFGAGSAEFYGIPYEKIDVPNVFETMKDTPLEITPGWYAISVNWLQGTFGENRRDYFQYFRGKSPVTQIGYSIHVYHVP
jgi:hypothetical protein